MCCVSPVPVVPFNRTVPTPAAVAGVRRLRFLRRRRELRRRQSPARAVHQQGHLCVPQVAVARLHEVVDDVTRNAARQRAGQSCQRYPQLRRIDSIDAAGQRTRAPNTQWAPKWKRGDPQHTHASRAGKRRELKRGRSVHIVSPFAWFMSVGNGNEVTPSYCDSRRLTGNVMTGFAHEPETRHRGV